MNNGIRDIIRQYIVDNFLLGEAADFNDSQSLLQTGVVDSTGILELVTFLEEHYGMVIADEEMLPINLDSVDNIAAFVSRKQNTADGLSSLAQSSVPLK